MSEEFMLLTLSGCFPQPCVVTGEPALPISISAPQDRCDGTAKSTHFETGLPLPSPGSELPRESRVL